MSFSFRAKVWKWPGDMGWYFVNVPKNIFEAVRAKNGKGLIRVRLSIGRTRWETSLLPHALSGTYLLAIKALVRKNEGIFEGDEVDITFCIIKK